MAGPQTNNHTGTVRADDNSVKRNTLAHCTSELVRNTTPSIRLMKKIAGGMAATAAPSRHPRQSVRAAATESAATVAALLRRIQSRKCGATGIAFIGTS